MCSAATTSSEPRCARNGSRGSLACLAPVRRIAELVLLGILSSRFGYSDPAGPGHWPRNVPPRRFAASVFVGLVPLALAAMRAGRRPSARSRSCSCGWPSDMYCRALEGLDPDAALAKPFSLDRLIETVQRFCAAA